MKQINLMFYLVSMNKLRFAIVISLIILAGCSGSRQIETDLYFGFSKPAGGMVSENEWKGFMQAYISPVFSSGFTVIPAQGKWLDDSTHVLISEPSVIVIAIHKKNKQTDVRIDSISTNYKRLFQQQAVLRVDKKVRVAL